MSTAQREATTALLRTALNERGLDKVRAVMALEITLRAAGGLRPVARPRELRARHLWRAGRRRLGLAHRGSPPLAALQPRGRPLRVDAASVFRREPGGGAARRGWRRAARGLSAARQRGGPGPSVAREPHSASAGGAIFDTRPFGDIVSRNAPRARPLDAAGLPFAEMDAAQQAQVLKLIGAFADHLQPELTEARLARVRAAPLDSIRSRLGWIGSAASAALLSHPGRELPDRVRQLGRQPHPLGVARLRR